jgi:hypothetical protein
MSERERLAREALQRAEAATEAMHWADQPGRLPLVSVHWAQFYSEDVPRLARALLEAEAEIGQARAENEELRRENNTHRAQLIEDVLNMVHDHKKGPLTTERAAEYLRKLVADALAASPTTEGLEGLGEEGKDGREE